MAEIIYDSGDEIYISRLKIKGLESQVQELKADNTRLFNLNWDNSLKAQTLEQGIQQAVEVVQPLIDTAETYAMQTYDRHGIERKKIEAAKEWLKSLSNLIAGKA